MLTTFQGSSPGPEALSARAQPPSLFPFCGLYCAMHLPRVLIQMLIQMRARCMLGDKVSLFPIYTLVLKVDVQKTKENKNNKIKKNNQGSIVRNTCEKQKCLLNSIHSDEIFFFPVILESKK